jgi:hypothetical protein
MEPNQIPPPPNNIYGNPNGPNGQLNQPLITKTSWNRYIKEKWVLIPIIVLVFIPLIIFLVAIRYDILGLFFKNTYIVEVVDRTTDQPIVNASVTLGGIKASTNDKGYALVKTSVGHKSLYISSNYYSTYSGNVLVPLSGRSVHAYAVATTGIEVPVTILDKLDLSPVAGAVISVDYDEVVTNAQGKATIALPTGINTLPGTISTEGYNTLPITLQVTTKPTVSNDFSVSPVGKVYYLSNDNGSINVDSKNLDGSDPTIVVQGTSTETAANTQLLGSNDWKYLALLTTRSAAAGQNLYIYNTTTDKLTDVDNSTNATFALYGWTPSDNLIYKTVLNSDPPYTPGGINLRSYVSDKNTAIYLDRSSSLGFDMPNYALQSLDTVNILANNSVIYTQTWSGTYSSEIISQSATIKTINSDGTGGSIDKNGGKEIKSFPEPAYVNPASTNYTPSEVYLSIQNGSAAHTSYFTYTNGTLSSSTSPQVPADISSPAYTSPFLISPSAKMSAWSQNDNNNSDILVGDVNAANAHTVAVLPSGYIPCGWFTDNYLLVKDPSNELFIVPISGVKDLSQLVKITDFL